MRLLQPIFRKILNLIEQKEKQVAQFAFYRHIGVLKNTGSKVVVVFMQIPGEPESCLVVCTESLGHAMHTDLMDIIESQQGQGEEKISNLLHRRSTTTGVGSILDALHHQRQLMKVSIDDVIMTPNPQNKIPLRTVLESMEKLTKTEQKVSEEKYNPTKEHQKARSVEENHQFANNLIFEATLDEQQATACFAAAKTKREQAYELCPSLRPEPKQKLAPVLPEAFAYDDAETATEPKVNNRKRKVAGE